MPDLFDNQTDTEARRESLATDAVLLSGFCHGVEAELLAALKQVVDAAPLRCMVTPGGYTMSVAMTNCGSAGWVTDRSGYRYAADDPESGRPWPAMPAVFQDLASKAASEAGFDGFVPDACLINRYRPGAKLSLHQDKDEKTFASPIVSVSLGLPATFLFGGLKRSDPPRRIRLTHGDIAVWGGVSRLAYHGILPLKDGDHPTMGRQRINLTFRKAL